MNIYYGRNAYRYFSKIEPARGFDTEEEAREFDRFLAVETLAKMDISDFVLALREGDAKLREILGFLREEIADAVAPAATETP